ncbi:MAG: beta-N-acetylhexosaminidase [Gammaproteobacteria bacterium]|nr:beta-N-acetylhexosaminidase [Gammaproteobacteria bacterium]
MSLGPVMLDVEGLVLTEQDRRRLLHPQTGGVILFSRNYESPEQLYDLVQEIHALRNPRLIVAVDQEGGRVQRFREGFQTLPPMAALGDLFDSDQQAAIQMSETVGWIMAAELLHYGIDLSFAPVLDLGHKISTVIGDRAFHTRPEIIVRLANALIRGMNQAGMEAVGKHFPGHGSVEGDSHHVMPFDRRSRDTIMAHDLVPFRQVIQTHLAGIMMAHVIYEQVDERPAGYSDYWIEQVLRQQLGFEGAVFSDDLSMSGAESVGGYPQRAQASLKAGCDMLLVCNNPAGADEVLDSLQDYNNPVSQLRLVRMHGHPRDKKRLFKTPRWQQSVAKLHEFMHLARAADSDDLFAQSGQNG